MYRLGWLKSQWVIRMNLFVVRCLKLLTDFIPLGMSTDIMGCKINSNKKYVVSGMCWESCLRLRHTRPPEVFRSFCSLGNSVMAETKTSSWPPELHWESFSWDGFNWPSDSVPSSHLCGLACCICLIECKSHHLAQVRPVLWLLHDRQLATTLCKGLLCTRARRDVRLLKPLRKSQLVLSCFGSP